MRKRTVGMAGARLLPLGLDAGQLLPGAGLGAGELLSAMADGVFYCLQDIPHRPIIKDTV
jgi:hypothetical protein